MTVRVGTCSWADSTMVKNWYPGAVKTAKDRLQYYARRFDTVEVDSSYYALPSKRNCQLWTERTPEDFMFHIKAFALMTQHSASEDRLPEALKRHDYRLTRYGNVKDPSPEMLEETFFLFEEGIEPLNEAGKLGLILMQFPPYFTFRDDNVRHIKRCRHWLEDYRLAVEFRHRSWLSPDNREDTFGLLKDLGLHYVSVDMPQVEAKNVLPPLAESTCGVAYVRFHGRNEDTWNKRVESAAERFKYRYGEEELREWVEPLAGLTSRAEEMHVMFNNCYRDYAPTNAAQMAGLLKRAGLSVTTPVADEEVRQNEKRQLDFFNDT